MLPLRVVDRREALVLKFPHVLASGCNKKSFKKEICPEGWGRIAECTSGTRKTFVVIALIVLIVVVVVVVIAVDVVVVVVVRSSSWS